MKHTFAAAISLGLATSMAAAQDYTLPPSYGDISLRAGFPSDPHTVDLQSGGSIRANTLRDNGSGNADRDGRCAGYIADAPDFSLHFTSGTGVLPLRIGAASGADTTLVINGPDGSWYCDDDGGEGLNPLIQFNNPETGRYDIWVGTFGSASLADARLFITEFRNMSASSVGYGSSSGGSSSGGGSVSGPDWRLNPSYETISLRGGFAPDPYTVDLQSGGPNRVRDTISDTGSGDAQRDNRCSGYIADAPDVRLNFTAGSLPLIISVASSSDTTLVINAPDGNWYCDDDSGQGTNPSIRWDRAQSGQYDIWVGTWASASLRDAVLHISELYSE
ncbi:peptidase [Glycocaulis sp.]